MSQRNDAGFTLIELMIAVVIAAILAAIAYPSYRAQVLATQRSTAQTALLELAQFMQRVHTEHYGYLVDGSAPGLPFTEAPKDASRKTYDLALSSVTATAYTLRATPKGNQAGDGVLEITSLGQRRWDRNDDGSFAASEQTWDR